MEIPPQAPPKLRVAAYVDATEEHFEPHAVSRVDAFEKAVAAAPNLEIQAHVVRNGTSAGTKLARGLGYLAMHVAPPVLGQAVFGLPGMLAGAAVTAYLVYKGYTLEAGKNLGGAFHQPFTTPGPFWKGTRTYEIVADQTDGIDSRVISQSDSVRPATPGELSAFVTQHLEPGQTNVLYIAGHGWGPWKVASMHTTALAVAVEKSQVKPDLVVFESCLMGNLEALSLLRQHASVAVVSEELMVAGGLGAGQLPIKSMLARAAREGGSPHEMGQRMVEVARQAGVPTLAAVDLKGLDRLLGELDDLAQAALKDLPTRREALREALQASQKVPQIDHELGGTADFADLGDFLKRLKALGLPADEAVQALGEAVLAHTAGPGNEATTGLSFCTRIPKGGEAIYAGLPLPGSFRKLVGELTTP